MLAGPKINEAGENIGQIAFLLCNKRVDIVAIGPTFSGHRDKLNQGPFRLRMSKRKLQKKVCNIFQTE